MGLFQQVEGEVAILIERGVYRQVDVYKRNGYLFAKVAGGFVRLNADGSTTKPTMRLETLTWENHQTIGKDNMGKLVVAQEVHGSTALDGTPSMKLLG